MKSLLHQYSVELFAICLILSCCTGNNDNAVQGGVKGAISRPYSLPFVYRGIDLVDTNAKLINYGDVVLAIVYRRGATSPIIFSTNNDGEIVDSALLFSQGPYFGTDSYFDPWVRISEDGVVSCTDTTIKPGPARERKLPSGKIQYEMTVDTIVSSNSFTISSDGKFSSTKR